MRTLSATLLQAQKQSSAVPYVKVEIVEKSAGIARPRWERLYTGAEPEGIHASTMPGDGSLLRARIDPASSLLYLQRVVNPGPGSAFSGWTSLGAVASAGIALCSLGARVLLFSVGTDGVTISVRESTDNGATFGSPATAAVAPAPVGWLAADFGQDDTVVALFYSTSAGTVYVVKRTGGSWGSPSAWSNSVASASGLACTYQGDWDLVVTGTDSSSNWKVWTCVYGDDFAQLGGTWSALREFTMANAGSGVEFRSPFLQMPDVFRVFYVEKYTGSVSYSRPLWSSSITLSTFADNLWREPEPFNLSSTYGLSLTSSGSYAWLSMASGVWRASLVPTPLDVTADVVEVKALWEHAGGRAVITLRNDDGRYNSPGTGAYAAITTGSQVAVSPGYRTGAGAEYSGGPLFWIEGWTHLSDRGRSLLLLEVGDGWRLLEQWRARRQFAWAAGEKNVFGLLAFVLARVGLRLSSFSLSSTVTNFYPAFTIHPGETGATAVKWLLSLAPDVLLFRDATAYLKYPQGTDATDYSYGTDHALFRGSYASRSQRANHLQVYGSSVFAEAFGWSELELVGQRLRQVHDLNISSPGFASTRAQEELQKEARAAVDAEIEAPANCGQELYDVVEITDPGAGLVAARRRVSRLALEHTARGRDPRYVMRLGLSAV